MPGPGPRSAQANQQIGNELLQFISSFFTNPVNQLNRIGGQDVPLYDPELAWRDVMENAGYEGPAATALGLVGDLAEPGPGELASISKLLGPALAAIPLSLRYADPDVRYVDPRELEGMAGNQLRTSAAEQTEFANRIEQEGFNEPAIMIFDPNTGRIKLGEGNHRREAAMELGEPLPVRANRGVVAEYEGRPASQFPAANRHNYIPADLPPDQFGIPVYNREQLYDYAIRSGMNEAQAQQFVANVPEDLPRGPEAPEVRNLSGRLDQFATDSGFTSFREAFESNRARGLPEDRIIEWLAQGAGVAPNQVRRMIFNE